jgi:DNA invertase Pin-like site-specific DNA recombinase
MVGDRAAIYCRVSTTKQAKEERYSLPYQLKQTRERCEERKYHIVQEYCEVHTGAELDERSEMTALRGLVRSKQIDVVVLIRLDRLARDQNHQGVFIYEAEKYGVRIELTDEEPYEDTAQGKFLRSVHAFMNEYERETIRYRTMNGMRERALAGKLIGVNRSPLYGYSWGDAERTFYVINERTAAVVVRIFTDAAAGIPLRRIAIMLTEEGVPTPYDDWRIACGEPSQGKAWNVTALSDVIGHPAYVGNHAAYREKTVKRKEVDTYTGQTKTFARRIKRAENDPARVSLASAAPAIVSAELAEAALNRLPDNQNDAPRRLMDPEASLLRGRVRCGLCGRRMSLRQARSHGVKKPGVYTYYCSKDRRTYAENERCTVGKMYAHKLDNRVWQGIVERLNDPERLFRTARERLSREGYTATIEGLQHNIREYEAGQKDLGQAIQTITASGRGGDSVAILATQLADLGDKKQDALKKLEKLQDLQGTLDMARARLHDAEIWCQAAAAAVEDMTFEQKRMTLSALKLRVDLYKAGTRPRWVARIGSFGEEDEIFTSEDLDSNGLWGTCNKEGCPGSISDNPSTTHLVCWRCMGVAVHT